MKQRDIETLIDIYIKYREVGQTVTFEVIEMIEVEHTIKPNEPITTGTQTIPVKRYLVAKNEYGGII